MCSESFYFACHKVSCNDTFGLTVDQDKIQHLMTRIRFHCTSCNLTVESSVGSEKKLLTGLSTGIEGTANLRTSERAVGEKSAVLPCKRNTLCHALVNDVVAHFCKTIDVRLTRTVVSSFDGIIEKTIDRVIVVLVVLCGIDTTLCCN